MELEITKTKRKKRNRKTNICPICGHAMYKDALTCRNCVRIDGKYNPNWKGGISVDNYRYKKTQKERYPKRVKARELLGNAIRSGDIKRGCCLICGEEKAEGHHEDYSKPLDVIWLCKKHHRAYHEGVLEI